jgi:toxin ParE1/3/4
MGRYTISDNAAADLATLWDSYIDRGGAETNADRLVSRLFETFQNLADFPEIGTRRAYLPAGYLALPYQEHMIFYRKSEEGVDILQVLYGGMDLVAYFGELE